ncbi:MAG TPA: IS5 family transposase [Gammaproteobacteria bacterium]|nr:IS5 family transposase [Gammaproteobacteria bacterium]
MPKPLVTDELWTVVEPLLPEQPPKPKGGRPRVNDRAALTGILFVLKTGIPWEMLPQEMGCGSGMTCWRRLKEWHKAGVWERLHRALLNRLGEADRIDRSRASLDSASVAAPGGGEKTGPNPTDRGKSGSKRHLLVDRCDVPLVVRHSAANVHDSRMLETMLDAVSPIRRPRGRPGRPRKRPEKLHADKGYDFARCRQALRKRGIRSRIARRGIESSERLGCHRWVVERTLAWLNRYRRSKVRYERRADVHQAFLSLGCALICWNHH